MGWDKNDLWKEILRVYPYGLKHDRSRGLALAKLASEVYRMAAERPAAHPGRLVHCVASRPPLYHTMLGLPDNAEELEKKLNVDVEGDFQRDRLARAGFATSGVSPRTGWSIGTMPCTAMYWKSYDFKTNEGNGNLFRSRSDPKFNGNEFQSWPSRATAAR